MIRSWPFLLSSCWALSSLESWVVLLVRAALNRSLTQLVCWNWSTNLASIQSCYLRNWIRPPTLLIHRIYWNGDLYSSQINHSTLWHGDFFSNILNKLFLDNCHYENQSKWIAHVKKWFCISFQPVYFANNKYNVISFTTLRSNRSLVVCHNIKNNQQ